MKLKSIMAAVAAAVALASPLAAKAYEYDDGTYKWGFSTYENDDKEQVATLYTVSRVDGKKIEGAITFPETVSLTVTNELGYSKLDDKTGKYNWVQTRERKIETLTLPVEAISWNGFNRMEVEHKEEWGTWISWEYQSDPLIKSITIPEGVKTVYGLVSPCLTNVTAVTFPSTVKSIMSCFGSCDKLASVTVSEDAYIDSAFIGTAWAKAMGDFFVWNGNLIRYQGTATEVVVPEGVAAIGTAAFSPDWWGLYDKDEMKRLASATNITSVLLPSSLEEIGTGAFSGCEKLAAIDIPNGVYSIGDSAFNGTALTSIALPKSIRSLGNDAFAYTAISSLVLPEGVRGFLWATCADMTNLTSVTLLGRVTGMEGTFRNCSKLTSVDIPASVEEIHPNTFGDCEALTSVTGGAGLKYVDSSAFGGEYYWDEEKGKYVTHVPFYDNAPDGFRVLGPVAYGYKGDLPENLTVPAGVKYVMYYLTSSASDKSAVKTITLSDGVETVGFYAFSSCDNLETVNLGNTVTNLGYSAFSPTEFYDECGYYYGPSKLATVTGGAALQTGKSAFDGTPFLENLRAKAGSDDPFGFLGVGNVVLAYQGQCPADVVIPDNVTDFAHILYNGSDEKESATNITSVTGGAGLRGYVPLYGLDNVKRIEISGAVESVDIDSNYALEILDARNAQAYSLEGYYIDWGATNLTQVAIGLAKDFDSSGYYIDEGFDYLDGSVFKDCDKLASLEFFRPGYKLTGYKANTGFEDEDFPNDLSTFKYVGYRTDFSAPSESGYVDWESLYLRPQFVKVMVDESSLEPFNNSVKSDYVGILYDAEGKFAGTFEASVKKASKTKDATATFKFTPVGGKKVTLKGTIDANGKGQGDLAGLTFGANGVVGKLTYTDKKGVTAVYEVSGSDNIAKSKDKSDKDFLKSLKGKAWGISGRAFDNVTESDFANGTVAMSIVMAGSGKAKVSGVLPNGTKVSQSVQLIAGADTMAIPLSFTKGKESFGFVLWLDEKARASRVEGCEWVGKGASSKDLFVAEFGDDARGNALVAVTGVPDPTFMLSARDLPKGLALTADALELLPRYEGFELKNGKADKWTFAKAPKVKFDKNGVLDVAALAKDIAADKTNVANLKLKLTKKSGEFKGSFNVWALDKKGKVKKQTVTVNGVMIDGIGYGSGFIKKVGAMPVQIGNENLRFVEED